MTRNAAPRPTDAELAILRILWDRGPSTVRQVHEILGLERTFSFYVDFPESDWPEIRKAEQMNAEGDREFARLQQKYLKDFFGAGQLSPIEA